MTYQDIETFLTIVTSPTLSKAAETLYITQPALSHRLSSLERELGTNLIVRQKGVRTIELTEAGKRFIPVAEKWEQLWQETKEINYKTPMAPLRIANVDSLNIYFMPKVYTGFIKNHKDCRLNISTMRSNASYEAIENQTVDLALITNPHFFKKVHTRPLFHESMKFICSKKADYAEVVSPDDLSVENEIFIPWSSPFLMWHDYWFGNTQEKRISLDNMSLFEQFLHLENAWAIVPSTIAYTLEKKTYFRTCGMTNGPEARTCYAIYGDKRKQMDLQQEFLHTLIQVAGQFPDVEIAKTQFRT